MKEIFNSDGNGDGFLSVEQRFWLETQLAFGIDAAIAEESHDYRAKAVHLQRAVLEKQQASPPIAAIPIKVAAVQPMVKKSVAPIIAPSFAPTAAPKATATEQKGSRQKIQAPKPAVKKPLAIGAARQSAQSLADQCENLQDLEQAVAEFDGCPLKVTASNLVFGAGVQNPAVMVIGEGPGPEEDRRGQAYVGASGRLMLRTLEIIGLRRNDNLYLSNIVYWRPPADRTPNDTEIAVCAPFLRRQIQLVQPKLILLAGAPASQSLLGVTVGITRLRGGWTGLNPDFFDSDIPVLPMFHPAYLFRNHTGKRLFWMDILTLRAKIDSLGLDVPLPSKGLDGFADIWQP